MTSRAVAVAVATALTVLPAVPAAAHTELRPGSAPVGRELRLVVVAEPEREPEQNAALSMVVPREFTAVSCDAPTGWTCGFDAATYAPHSLVRWRAGPEGGQPRDVEFGLTVVTPDLPGTWLFRAVQVHADGYREPWAYDTEPFPSTRLVVGGSGTLRNPDGSPDDPPCFGPDVQPASYEAHDGSGRDTGCAPSPSPTPTPTTSPSPTPSASTTPTTPTTPTTSTSASPSATPSPSPTPSPTGTPTPTPSATASATAPAAAPPTTRPTPRQVPRPASAQAAPARDEPLRARAVVLLAGTTLAWLGARRRLG